MFKFPNLFEWIGIISIISKVNKGKGFIFGQETS
jgi:hypothetical protein